MNIQHSYTAWVEFLAYIEERTLKYQWGFYVIAETKHLPLLQKCQLYLTILGIYFQII